MTGLLAITLTGMLAAPATAITMGDGAVDGRRIEPYDLEWRQCSLQDGAWVDLGPLRESAVEIGEVALRVRQETTRPDGGQVIATTYFDRTSLSPLRIEQNVTTATGEPVARAEFALGPDGYEGMARRGGKSQQRSGAITRNMYQGAALGLPLATLDPSKAPFIFDASMMGFNATYRVEATLAGTETLRYRGEAVEVVLIDLRWEHNEIGDVYPPGPDASGGRFWIAQSPPEGFPYVPKYKTDSYAVEFIADTCAVSDEAQSE